MESLISVADTGGQPNNDCQDEDEESEKTSPSLLVNSDPLLTTTPSRDYSKIVNHKWMKRKRRKRLKQTTLTQHQNVHHKSLSLKKLDRSVKVIPQSPFIDLSTLPSGSSDDNQDLFDDGISDECDSSSDYMKSSDNRNSQNCETTNQGDGTDYTFVPDNSQDYGTGNQHLSIIGQQHNSINPDYTFVHEAPSQMSNLTNQNHDPSNHDRTFVNDVTSHTHSKYPPDSNVQNSNEKQLNFTNQNRNLQDQR